MIKYSILVVLYLLSSIGFALAQIGSVPPTNVISGVIVPPGLVVTDGYLARPQTAIQTISQTGTYRISIYFEITSAAGGVTGDNSVSVYWTDDASEQRTITSPAIPRVGGYYQNTIITRMLSGSTIDYSTLNFNGAAGVNNWHLYVTIEKLS